MTLSVVISATRAGPLVVGQGRSVVVVVVVVVAGDVVDVGGYCWTTGWGARCQAWGWGSRRGSGHQFLAWSLELCHVKVERRVQRSILIIKYTDTQTHRHTDTQTHRHTHTHTDTHM